MIYYISDKVKSSTDILIIILIGMFISCGDPGQSLTEFVDPFIGTGGSGHTYPGVTLPFGSIQLSPDCQNRDWNHCSGYHYNSNTIEGFSHTHLSGTGASDYGDIMVMPITGNVKLNAGEYDSPDRGYRSRFSHDQEVAEAGYYRVKLLDYNVTAELTATQHVGVHRYTFPQTEKAHILFDLVHGIQDQAGELFIKIVNQNEIVGYRCSHGWAREHCFYFVAKLSKAFTKANIYKDDCILLKSSEARGKNIKLVLDFQTEPDEQILMNVALSAVSIEGAYNNLKAEIAGWDFDYVATAAKKSWQNSLSKIKVEALNLDQQIIFYTALYHSLLAPNIFMDVDNRFRGMDGEIHKAVGFTNYTVFSLWDTYRAVHPLFTLIESGRNLDMINSMLKKYDQSGLLPVWELASNETNCMIGYHSIPVIVDAWMKGYKNFDIEHAFKAMKSSAEQEQPGLKAYREQGYLPANIEHESVSKTLEYSYDDWCIARVAGELGKTDDYQKYIERANYFRNVFDKETNFMRPVDNGRWTTPFNPKSVSGHYTEANAWQYSFLAPQDVTGLIELFGGKEIFDKKLDAIYDESPDLSGRYQPDISGQIGQYAHGNEPSHHMAYLYNFIGKPWKTQALVRKINTELYSTGPDGLCGNDDCGQMSAWYIFSVLGFYPFCPGEDYYVIGSPMVKKAEIKVGMGKTFTIIAKNNSLKNKYINSVMLNGENYTKSYISHQDIVNGGELKFIMSDSPNFNWGNNFEDLPKSKIMEKFTANPRFGYAKTAFYKEQTVTLDCIDENAIIYYTIDGSKPTINSTQYSEPLKINKSVTIQAMAQKSGYGESRIEKASFIKIPYKRDITLSSEFDDLYAADGPQTLVDFIHGGHNYRSGDWLGFEEVDVIAEIDLGKIVQINSVKAECLQDINTWIFLPEYVEYSFSEDGKKYRNTIRVNNTIPKNQDGVLLNDYPAKIDERTRFVKVVAKNIKRCPEWHKGAGGKTWIFIDEIIID